MTDDRESPQSAASQADAEVVSAEQTAEQANAPEQAAQAAGQAAPANAPEQTAPAAGQAVPASAPEQAAPATEQVAQDADQVDDAERVAARPSTPEQVAAQAIGVKQAAAQSGAPAQLTVAQAADIARQRAATGFTAAELRQELNRSRRARTVKRVVITLLCIVIVVLAALVAFAFLYPDNTANPAVAIVGFVRGQAAATSLMGLVPFA